MKKNIFKLLPYLLIGTILTLLVLYIYKYNAVFLDSDASSELVLAKLLNESGSIMSSNWYYSTEPRVINTNLIFAPLFSIFDSWTKVRAVGTGICLLLMILSALYLYSQLEIKNKAILACLLLLPISVQYFGMYIAHPFYEFSTIKSYLFIGMIINYLKTNKTIKRNLLLILLILLSLLQGIEGLRNILLTVLPIVIIYISLEILQYKDKFNPLLKEITLKCRRIIPFLLLACVIGYLFNALVLSNIYSYSTFNNMKFKLISFNNVSQLLNSWLNVFGYVDGKVFSTNLLHNLLAILTFVISIIIIIDNLKYREELSNKIKFLTIIYVIDITILILLQTFVRYEVGELDITRYNLPVYLFLLPLVFEWLENRFSQKKFSKVLGACFVILMFICGIDNLNTYRNNDNRSVLKNINTWREDFNNYELLNISKQLLDQNYRNGYSYFWDGNIITELTNGQIEMWVLGNGGTHTNELNDFNSIYKWLQKTNHSTEHPKDKVFILLSKDELNYSGLVNRLSWDNVIYDSERFTAYGYDSYEQLINDFYN